MDRKSAEIAAPDVAPGKLSRDEELALMTMKAMQGMNRKQRRAFVSRLRKGKLV